MLPKSITLPLVASDLRCYDADKNKLFIFCSDGTTTWSEDVQAAAHIVACVNACEGMADPAAEMAKLQAHKKILLDVLKHLPPRLLNDTLQKLNNL